MKRGIPYSLKELEAVSKSNHAMDEYHRHLMQWAVKEIKRLKRLLTGTVRSEGHP